MIKTVNGLVEVSGTNDVLFNDLSSICGYLRDCLRDYLNEETAQEKILLAVERGFLISKDMDVDTIKAMQKLTKKIEGGE